MHADRVVLVEPRGFCAGVEMATRRWPSWSCAVGLPVYCVHDIVHNDRAVARFRRLGVRFVDRLSSFRPAYWCCSAPTALRRARLAVAAARVLGTDRQRLPARHQGPPRARRPGRRRLRHRGTSGTMATTSRAAPSAWRRIGPVSSPASRTSTLPRTGRPVAVLAQTTLAVDEWTKWSWPPAGASAVWTARREDICYATSNRQRALRDVAGAVDAVIVVGSASSANTSPSCAARRAGVAASCAPTAPASSRRRQVATVAVTTAGASAPDDAVCRSSKPSALSSSSGRHRTTSAPTSRFPAALRRLLADDDEGAALLALERELSAAELLARVEATITARAA